MIMCVRTPRRDQNGALMFGLFFGIITNDFTLIVYEALPQLCAEKTICKYLQVSLNMM